MTTGTPAFPLTMAPPGLRRATFPARSTFSPQYRTTSSKAAAASATHKSGLRRMKYFIATGLYDRHNDDVSMGEVERIGI
jgi:hypothetical protein